VHLVDHLILTMLQVFDPEFRKPFPSVERYFSTLARQPQFAAVVGSDWKLPAEALKYTRACSFCIVAETVVLRSAAVSNALDSSSMHTRMRMQQ